MKQPTSGYDKLSLLELDLIFKEEFHNRPEEDYEQWLIASEKKDSDDDAAWEAYIEDKKAA